MDTNDSKIKSQQTGGLKLMTVFIAVLALHVVVIGGFTAYHLMSGGSTDADLTTTDKTHKDGKAADGTMIVDSTSLAPSVGDKNAPSPAPAPSSDAAPSPAAPAPTADQVTTTTEVSTPATAPAPTPATAPATVASAGATAPAPMLVPAPAPTLTLNAPKVGLLTPPPDATTPTASAPTGPISPDLAPPAEPAPTSLAAGPVHMPSTASSAAAATPKIEHEHMQVYTVKITDSYRKIAKAHHITVAQLKEANHIKGNTLHTGQKLEIPSTGSIVATNTSATGTEATATRTVLNESTTTESLAAAPAGEASTGAHRHLYTVAKGDTLAKIAHRFKTTPLAIMEVNDIADPAKLTIGKKLRIPSRESRSAKNTPPATTPPSEVNVKQQEATASAQLANFSL